MNLENSMMFGRSENPEAGDFAYMDNFSGGK